jgi:hypothetical protein
MRPLKVCTSMSAQTVDARREAPIQRLEGDEIAGRRGVDQ